MYNTDKVSQGIQYQTAELFTTYSGGGGSVSFINWWVGRFELPAQAKLAVVLLLRAQRIFMVICAACGCARVAFMLIMICFF